MLKLSDVEFEYVNIHADSQAAAHVRAINNGYESVPTLVFPDGATLTEPSTLQLKRKLQAMGYKVSLPALLSANIWRIVFYGILTYAILRFLDVF